VSFEVPPSPDPENPVDVARIAREVLQKLADQADNRYSVKDLYDRYFEAYVPEEIIIVAAEALVVHRPSPVVCEGQELVLENEHGVTDYCDLICSSGPDEPVDLLEKRELYFDEVSDLSFGEVMNTHEQTMDEEP